MVPKEEAVSLLQRVLRANTVNPPGNELETALILRDFFDAHGVEAEVDEFLTGRANLIARLPGNGVGRGSLILCGHMDVVPVGGSAWDTEPFAAELRDGRIYGRGASDMKSGLVATAVAVANLKQSGATATGVSTFPGVSYSKKQRVMSRRPTNACGYVVSSSTGAARPFSSKKTYTRTSERSCAAPPTRSKTGSGHLYDGLRVILTICLVSVGLGSGEEHEAGGSGGEHVHRPRPLVRGTCVFKPRHEVVGEQQCVGAVPDGMLARPRSHLEAQDPAGRWDAFSRVGGHILEYVTRHAERHHKVAPALTKRNRVQSPQLSRRSASGFIGVHDGAPNLLTSVRCTGTTSTPDFGSSKYPQANEMDV